MDSIVQTILSMFSCVVHMHRREYSAYEIPGPIDIGFVSISGYTGTTVHHR